MPPPYDAVTCIPDPGHRDLAATAPFADNPEPYDADDGESLLRTSDVAALFQVSSRTVSEWARRGRVPCLRTPGGQWRYPAEPIRQLLNRPEEHDPFTQH